MAEKKPENLMTFGPDWLHNLSQDANSTNSNSSAVANRARSNPARCQLADHRYGREEMLALFDNNCSPPRELSNQDALFVNRAQLPIALLADQDDEARRGVGGWNPRIAPPRGPPPMMQGVRPQHRNISRGNFRATHYMPDFTRPYGNSIRGGLGRGEDVSFGRGIERGHSRGSSRGAGMMHPPPDRPGAEIGDWDNQGYSDGHREYNNSYTRWSNDGNWRRQHMARGPEDDDGWRANEHPHPHPHQRPRPPQLGKKLSWRSDEEENRFERVYNRDNPNNEREWPDKRPQSWVNRRGRPEDSPEDLPEWANTENLLGASGTFDSTGAFHSIEEENHAMDIAGRLPLQHSLSLTAPFPEKKGFLTRNHTQGHISISHRAHAGAPGLRSGMIRGSSEDWSSQPAGGAKVFSATDIDFLRKKSITTVKLGPVEPTNDTKKFAVKKEEKLMEEINTIPPFPINKAKEPKEVKEIKDVQETKEVKEIIELKETKDRDVPENVCLENGNEATAEPYPITEEPPTLLDESSELVDIYVTFESIIEDIPAGVPPLIQDLVKVLDEEDPEVLREDYIEPPSSTRIQPIPSSPKLVQHTEESNSWYYRDPQGEVQGPFTSLEMGEWFNSGYFAETLMVRYSRDAHFVRLGTVLELSMGQNPFMLPENVVLQLFECAFNASQLAPIPPMMHQQVALVNAHNYHFMRKPCCQHMGNLPPLPYGQPNMPISEMPPMNIEYLNLVSHPPPQFPQPIQQVMPNMSIPTDINHLDFRAMVNQPPPPFQMQNIPLQPDPSVEYKMENQWVMPPQPVYPWPETSQSSSPSPVQLLESTLQGQVNSLAQRHFLPVPIKDSNIPASIWEPPQPTQMVSQSTQILPQPPQLVQQQPQMVPQPQQINAQQPLMVSQPPVPQMIQQPPPLVPQPSQLKQHPQPILLEHLYTSINQQHPSTLANNKDQKVLMDFIQGNQSLTDSALLKPSAGLPCPELSLPPKQQPNVMLQALHQPLPMPRSQKQAAFKAKTENLSKKVEAAKPVETVKKEQVDAPIEAKPKKVNTVEIKKEILTNAKKEVVASELKKAVENHKVAEKKKPEDKKKIDIERKKKNEVPKPVNEKTKISEVLKKKKVGAATKEVDKPIPVLQADPDGLKKSKSTTVMVDRRAAQLRAAIGLAPWSLVKEDNLSFNDIQKLEQEQKTQQMQIQLQLEQQAAAAKEREDLQQINNRKAMQLRWVDQKPPQPGKVLSLAAIQAEEQGTKKVGAATKEVDKPIPVLQADPDVPKKSNSTTVMVDRRAAQLRAAIGLAPWSLVKEDNLSFNDIQKLEREQKTQQMQIQLQLEQQAAAAKERVVTKPVDKEQPLAVSPMVSSSGIWGPPGVSNVPWWQSSTEGFWDAPAPTVSQKKTENAFNNKSSQATQEKASPTPKTESNGKTYAPKDNNKKEQSTPVKKPEAFDELISWSTFSLLEMGTKIDIQTFLSFLKNVEAPYEVKEYVKYYVGDNKACSEFARQFIEKRSRLLRRNANPAPSDDLCAPAQAVNPGIFCNDFQDAKGKVKKVKKNRMLKIDSRILGFNVTAAADRFNIGDIDTA